MLRIITFLICFLILTTSVRALWLDDNVKEKIINLESTNIKYNFGSLEKDKIIQRTVRIKNKLNQPLSIKEARSACECIKAHADSVILDKDEIMDVEIIINTHDMGRSIEEVVYILVDNIDYELIRLIISAAITNSK
jgi:hypothetical protein